MMQGVEGLSDSDPAGNLRQASSSGQNPIAHYRWVAVCLPIAMDALAWTLLLNTLLLAGATCAISLPLGTLLGWLLARTDLPGREAGMVLMGVMLFVPLYLQAAAWQAGFGLQGWYTLTCDGPVWLEGFPGAIWVHGMAAVPWTALIVGVGFRLIEPELEEQALLNGSARAVFVRVSLRRALGAVGVAAVWVTIVTAGEMTVTDLFLVRTYAEELYTRLALGQPPEEAISGMLPGMVIAAALVVAMLVLSARLVPPPRPGKVRPRWVFRLGRYRVPATLLVVLLLVLLVGVPLGNLCYKGGLAVTQTDTARLRSWSLEKLLRMIAAGPWRYRREFGWSLAIGGLSATAAVVAAIGLAWPARRGGLRAVPALVATAVFLVVPGPAVALGTIWLLNRPLGPLLPWLYDDSILAPWLVLSVRGLPPATLILWHALRTIPGEMLDSAAVDGAGWFARLWRVALPCRLPAVALAWIVAFAVALGDLAASIVVVPPGVTTLSIQVFGLLHFGVEDRVAGICLGLIAAFAVMAVSTIHLARRWGSQQGAG